MRVIQYYALVLLMEKLLQRAGLYTCVGLGGEYSVTRNRGTLNFITSSDSSIPVIAEDRFVYHIRAYSRAS